MLAGLTFPVFFLEGLLPILSECENKYSLIGNKSV